MNFSYCKGFRPQLNFYRKALISNKSEDLSEYVPVDKQRFVSELKTPTLTTKIETIRIGEKKYTRKDSGEWKEVTIEKKTPPKGNIKIIVEADEYRYIGQEIVSGQNAEIYQRNTKHKITSEKNSAESFSTIKAKYWFNKNRLIITERYRNCFAIKSPKYLL
jgi:hypothetical protein